MTQGTATGETTRVPTGLYLQSRLFAATAGLWRKLGDLETSVLAENIQDIRIEAPIYVSSLARAGTTIVTEMLERHPDVTEAPSPFEVFCDLNPSNQKCLIYDD